jgi:hypothetical protein
MVTNLKAPALQWNTPTAGGEATEIEIEIIAEIIKIEIMIETENAIEIMIEIEMIRKVIETEIEIGIETEIEIMVDRDMVEVDIVHLIILNFVYLLLVFLKAVLGKT